MSQTLEVGDMLIGLGQRLELYKPELAGAVSVPSAVRELIADFQRVPHAAYCHGEVIAEFGIVVNLPTERVGHVNALRLTARPEHSLQGRIKVLPNNSDAVEEVDLKQCVARQKATNNGGLLWEF